jgi:serine/threonine-protein kinase
MTKNDPDERYARASLAVPELSKVLSMAPSIEGGERGVRARVAALMKTLWPHEPNRSRAEFQRLLKDARKALDAGGKGAATPDAGPVSATLAKATEPSDPSILLGTPYKLVKRIGEGASGVVWEAEHVELGRRVALKVLSPEHASSQIALERFRTEARAVAKLSHGNLVGILDFGKSLDGRAYLAMELLVGETLDVRLRQGPLAWREAVRIATEAGQALVAAHVTGLVHRDIKPANLFLTRAGQVKLLDFGVATALTPGSDKKPSEKERAMRGFAIFGTPEYMAPEQVSGDAVDGRTDVYALGCVLYEMLTGKRAFDGPSSMAVLGKQLRETPRAPRVQAGDRDIPPALDAVVMKAMKKAPAERFASALEMCAALAEIEAAPARRTASIRRWVSATSMGLALIAAAAGSAWFARAHASALDVPLPSQAAASVAPPPAPTPSATPAPIPTVVYVQAPASPAPTPLLPTVSVTNLPHDTHPPARSHAPSRSTSQVVHLDRPATPGHEIAHR